MNASTKIVSAEGPTIRTTSAVAVVAGEAPYPGRKARERARRCAEVLAVARRRFARKGYRQTTMVEIAGASELAIGTLYQLFPSKEAILYSLIEQAVDGLVARVRGATGNSTDARHRVAQIVRTQLAFSRENADVLRLYLSGWIGYDVSLRQRFGARIDRKYEEYLALVVAALRGGIRAGAFARRSPRRVALALAGMVHALIRRWLLEPRLNLEAEGEALLDIFFHGALPAGRAGSRPR